MNKLLGQMDANEFETLLDAFIERRSGEEDRLPAQTFFELLAEQEKSLEPVDLHITFSESGPIITAPSDAPLTNDGHRIRLHDGCEIVLHFDANRSEPVST
jgi:hypothetical protein